MYRHQDCYLSTEEWARDEDVWAKAFEKLLAVTYLGKMAPGWQFAEVDPYDLVKKRNRQRMYLGRYGRQDYFAWDDREISELDRASEALTELLEQENAFARMEEERG